MGFEMRMGLQQRQELRLNHKQKLKLEQLLKLEQELHHPEIPEAARGIKGMVLADTILKAKAGVGLLVGGLAETVWKTSASPEDLNSHKDVDVLVLGNGFPLEKEFEGGIDWWLPKKKKFDRISSSSGGNMIDIIAEWYENGNGIVLRYYPEYSADLKPGLYIPSPDIVTAIKSTELETFSLPSEDYDEDVSDVAARKIRRRMSVNLNPEIKKVFSENVLTGDNLQFYSHPHDIYVATTNQKKG
ncbi:MAG: hypothetical protein Q8P97_01490 [bacterium]|nr:hypothetical protein [bacterium]